MIYTIVRIGVVRMSSIQLIYTQRKVIPDILILSPFLSWRLTMPPTFLTMHVYASSSDGWLLPRCPTGARSVCEGVAGHSCASGLWV